MKDKILGIITARGGSKRVPRKNIKEFCKKPLLAWSIEVGKKANVFDRFILSTDDKEIADIGRGYGIDVPFMRPAELAIDTSGSFGVIKHAVKWLIVKENFVPFWVILLEPSSPGRQAFHIQEVVEIIQKRDDFDSLVGISEMPAHLSYLKELQMDSQNLITRVGDGEILRLLIHRNQDVPKTYFHNSAIYAFKASNLFSESPSLWGDSTCGYLMDIKYAIDIDTPDDWVIAEAKMNSLLEEQEG